MNMKCAICGSDKFHVDVDRQILSCTSCSFYCDLKALVRGTAVPQQQQPAYNPADFEIVGGVLKKYKGAAVNVVVPDGVIVIGDHAFYALKCLESVRLPKGVRTIESSAFHKCDNLKTIVLSDTLQEIGPDAFRECLALTSIILPEGLRKIGFGAFAYSPNLKSINIPNSVEQIGSTCFSGCDNLATITYSKNRFPIHTFDGSLFHRRTPEGQHSLIRNKTCPNCLGELGMFKKCKKCGKSW